MVECGGNIYLVGGRDGVEPFADVHIFDPVAEKWYRGPSMNQRRAFLATATCSGCIFSIGGMQDRESTLGSAERLDPRVVQSLHTCQLSQLIN